MHRVEGSLVAPTALTTKGHLADIDNDDDDELQNDEDKDEMVRMSDTHGNDGIALPRNPVSYPKSLAPDSGNAIRLVWNKYRHNNL